MTDNDDNLRAAHQAEQAEMQNQLQTETEFNDWFRGWKRDDLTADLHFNHARTRHTIAIATHFEAKAAFWSGLVFMQGLLMVIIVIAALITGIKVIW